MVERKSWRTAASAGIRRTRRGSRVRRPSWRAPQHAPGPHRGGSRLPHPAAWVSRAARSSSSVA
ncbi:hypothetical protein QJS66_13400 [Kocuria rhizophila]|nr:hypothetical protein QJS66_13400 [Kocuria rhizophila]